MIIYRCTCGVTFEVDSPHVEHEWACVDEFMKAHKECIKVPIMKSKPLESSGPHSCYSCGEVTFLSERSRCVDCEYKANQFNMKENDRLRNEIAISRQIMSDEQVASVDELILRETSDD